MNKEITTIYKEFYNTLRLIVIEKISVIILKHAIVCVNHSRIAHEIKAQLQDQWNRWYVCVSV